MFRVLQVVHLAQPEITCSKLTIETLTQGVKNVINKEKLTIVNKVNNKETRAASTIGVVLVSLLLTLNIFHTLFYRF